MYYRLRVEGVMLKGGSDGRATTSGGIVFEHEQPLRFSRKFLSILISTNKVRHITWVSLHAPFVVERTESMPCQLLMSELKR